MRECDFLKSPPAEPILDDDSVTSKKCCDIFMIVYYFYPSSPILRVQIIHEMAVALIQAYVNNKAIGLSPSSNN